MPKNSNNKFIRYIGLASEMGLIILAGAYGGIRVDEFFDTKPLLTAILSLFGVFAAIYLAVKDL